VPGEVYIDILANIIKSWMVREAAGQDRVPARVATKFCNTKYFEKLVKNSPNVKNFCEFLKIFEILRIFRENFSKKTTFCKMLIKFHEIAAKFFTQNFVSTLASA
jgi:hypothetical protein